MPVITGTNGFGPMTNCLDDTTGAFQDPQSIADNTLVRKFISDGQSNEKYDSYFANQFSTSVDKASSSPTSYMFASPDNPKDFTKVPQPAS
jgi:hypothetical protein